MSNLHTPVGPEDHSQGSPKAPVTLLEYGDYECPYCGQAYPIVKAVQRKLGARLRFVFRNFPISNIHPHAELAAEAAEAAAAQDRFWEMHDALYENQDRLDGKNILVIAEKLGLDMEKFASDVQARKFKERVKTDFMSGVKSGVNGTPSFFINGVRYDESWDEQTLIETLESLAET
jgi:protein-disulfide isomerase